MWQLWRAAAGQEPVQQRARGHQARAHEVQSAPTTSRVQVPTYYLTYLVSKADL